MTVRIPAVITAVVALALAGHAVAQTMGAPAQQQPPQPGVFIASQGQDHMVTSEVIGLPVVNAQNENLGKISDLILDPQSRVVGAVLTVGGFLGLGGKAVGVPWGALQFGEQDNRRVATIKLSPEWFANAPEFKTQADIRRVEQERSRQELQRMPMDKSGGTGGAGGMGRGTQ